MGGLRFVTFAVSFVLHAAVALPFFTHAGGEQAAFDEGVGADLLKIEQGVALVGTARGVDAENLIIDGGAEEVPAQVATQTVQEIKPEEPLKEPTPDQPDTQEVPELNDVISAKAEPVEESVITEKVEPETVKEVQPEQAVAKTTVQQIQARELVASGKEQKGGDTTKRTAYLGKLQRHISAHKIDPKTRRTGTVIVRFTVSSEGKLLSHEITKSSGSEKLDKAALAALESAAPFPPFPEGVTGSELALSVPFRFLTR